MSASKAKHGIILNKNIPKSLLIFVSFLIEVKMNIKKNKMNA